MKQKIQIINEDEDFLVLNKPAGLVVHPDGRTEEPTLVDWLLARYPDIKNVGEPLLLKSGEVIIRPGIVHRIDRETSGVLVIAKNQKSFLHLKKQFQDSEVSKKYNAFVYGEVKLEEGEGQGVINRPIGRSAKDFRLWSAQRGAKGKEREAITEYSIIKATKGYSFIEARPKTGRTHQIRVHFKAINHPVVADRLYAPKKEPLLGFERLALHAKEISFLNLDGNKVTYEASYPDDFREAIGQAL